MFRILGKTESCLQSKRTVFFKKSYRDATACFKFKSHYAALELDSTATPQQIKAAYYRLSLKYHPDKNNGSKESVQKFREISEAYEVLNNAEKKKSYDSDVNYQAPYWREQSFSPRSRRNSPPRTGRDKYYNYDEHYRQHYEEYERQQRVHYEHFKRRWDADFRRRNPYQDIPDYSSYKERAKPEIDWKLILRQNKFLLYFITGWIGLFFFTYVSTEIQNPKMTEDQYKMSRNYRNPKQTKLYYTIHDNTSVSKEN